MKKIRYFFASYFPFQRRGRHICPRESLCRISPGHPAPNPVQSHPTFQWLQQPLRSGDVENPCPRERGPLVRGQRQNPAQEGQRGALRRDGAHGNTFRNVLQKPQVFV